MNTIEDLKEYVNKRSLKIIGEILFPIQMPILSESDFLICIRKKWVFLYLHPKGRILSFNWLKTHFTSQQLKDAKIYLSGTHRVEGDAAVGDKAKIYHFGEGRIYAAGKSVITDYGYGKIYAGDDTSIFAFHSKRVFAKGHAFVNVYSTRPKIQAWQHSVIVADTYTTIKAHGNVHAICKNGGYMIAKDESFFEVFTYEHFGELELYNKSIAIVHGKTKAFVADEAIIKAYDECTITIEDKGIVHAYNNSKIMASCEARVYASKSAKVSLSDSAVCKIVYLSRNEE